jgi:hypothetical protein
MNKPTTLYRFYDASDTLLYVGISELGPGRWKAHRKEKPWWTDVAKATTCHYESRTDALDAERAAIQSEKPKHNVVHNTGSAPTTSRRRTRRRYPSLDATWMPTQLRGTYMQAMRAVDAYLKAWPEDHDESPLDYLEPGARLLEVSDCCRYCVTTRQDYEPRPPVAFDETGRAMYECHSCGDRWTCGWANDIDMQQAAR